MFKNRFVVYVPLALGLALSACNRSDNAPTASTPSQDPDYSAVHGMALEKEMLALKAGETDQGKLEQKMRETMARFGYPVQAPADPAGTEAAPAPQEGALGKAAAAARNVNTYRTVKNFNFDLPYTSRFAFSINPGVTLRVFTRRTPEEVNVDPVLVGYYETSGPSATARLIQVVGVSDDASGRDADFTWTNSTGATKVVQVVSFAYSDVSSGGAVVTIRRSNVFKDFVLQRTMGGVVKWTNNSINTTGCTGPSSSRITLKRVFGGGFQNNLLAVNAATMRGGVIYEGSNDVESLDLADVLTSGGKNFLLGSFSMDGTLFEATRFNAVQADLYSCPSVGP
ncbi:MAG: hypothetical protein JWO30_4999 [Fibrobacteres bacterium]|nr:hypothetical protein [Fibrobacterota bacterium]